VSRCEHGTEDGICVPCVREGEGKPVTERPREGRTWWGDDQPSQWEDD
jgi:hypothetical protein